MKTKTIAPVIRWVLFLGLVSLLGLGLKMGFFAISPYQPDTTPSENAEIFVLHKGEKPNEVTKRLIETGVISDGYQFVLLGKITRQWGRLKAGEYRVRASMNPIEIFQVLTSGVSIPHPITIREGENMYEVASTVEKSGLATSAELLELATSPQFIRSLSMFQDDLPPTLEGYLYPDTYHFSRTQSASEILTTMVRRFKQVWTPELSERAKQIDFSRHEVITLASIIEKETGASQERSLISSVFHNRLKKKMRLQSDPTTIYGVWKNYTGNLRKRDLQEKNNYNTYTMRGLPIGPISNPGKEAIFAALFPKDSPYYFFVSHNDGTHEFSVTFKDHNKAVQKYQLNPKARQGKSWKNLNQASQSEK